MSVLRLFVALVPCDAHRARLGEEARRVAALEPAARAVRPDNVHLTLAFLGAVPAAEAETVEGALRGVAASHGPLRVRWAGLGAFPSPHRPRVVWAGVAPGEGDAAVVALARSVEAALAAVGHAVDARDRFHPHVTLARLDGPPRRGALEKALTAGTLQSTYEPEVLSDLLLMVSENDGRGVRYRPLASVPLAGAADEGGGRSGETGGGVPASS